MVEVNGECYSRVVYMFRLSLLSVNGDIAGVLGELVVVETSSQLPGRVFDSILVKKLTCERVDDSFCAMYPLLYVLVEDLRRGDSKCQRRSEMKGLKDARGAQLFAVDGKIQTVEEVEHQY